MKKIFTSQRRTKDEDLDNDQTEVDNEDGETNTENVELDEEDEEEDEEEEEEDEEEEDDDDDDEKAIRRKKVIQLTIALGVIYLGYTYYEEDILKKMSTAKKNITDSKLNLTKTKNNKPPQSNKSSNTLQNLKKNNRPITPKAEEKKTPKKTSSEDEFQFDDDLDKLTQDIENNNQTNLKKMTQNEVIQDQKPPFSANKQIIDPFSRPKQEQPQQSTIKTNMDLAPSSLPNLRKWGRGLVYSCIDQHYSCINQSNYKLVEHWYKYSQTKGQKIKYLPINVYSTDYDCQNAQDLRMYYLYKESKCL